MSFLQPDRSLHSTESAEPILLDKVEKDCLLDARAAIHWKTPDCSFSDWRYLHNINLWRDYMPLEVESQLQGQTAGSTIYHSYQEGELLEPYQKALHKTVGSKQFQPAQTGLQPICPHPGRFYPKDFFTGIDGIYQGNKFPCRITAIGSESISVDLNHPLAGRKIDLEFHIERIKKSGAERGGRCNDIPSLLCDYGPGMQVNLNEGETAFRHKQAFSRIDESDDAQYFSEPDMTPFWDSTALSVMSSLYNELLADDMLILDLMSGVHSPLQESGIQPAGIICAGLNPQELESNPICTQFNQLNVNSLNALDIYGDTQFDSVVIHAAIEYVTQPDHLMAQITRILKPGGRIIISFSNRSVTAKVIQIWNELHEFERPALVLNYLQNTNSFTNFNSFSMRGYFRPEDDKLADRLLYSDPVYAVWADKK